MANESESFAYLTFMFPSADDPLLAELNALPLEHREFDRRDMDGAVELAMAIVGVSIGAWQVLEKFLEAHRDRRDAHLILEGKRYSFAEIDVAEIRVRLNSGRLMSLKLEAEERTPTPDVER